MPKFKIVAGKHSEKNSKGVSQLYNKGDIVDSKSDLSRLNAPGAIKFELVGETREEAEAKARERGRATGPSDDTVISSKAPGGQVGSGVQGQTATTEPHAAPRNKNEFHASLDRMNLKQLQDVAAEEEIDLRGETDVNKIRKTLKAV